MILITRPFDDAKKMAKILKKSGINSFMEPMLEIAYREPDLDEDNIQSYIATSKHGKLFVPEGAPLASIPRQGVNAEELVYWVKNNLNPMHGKLVYLRGETISYDINIELKKSGFNIEEIVVYKTLKRESFSERLVKNLNKITIATFFSNQSLKTFETLLSQHGLENEFKNAKIICLSNKIAKSITIEGKEIHIAEAPNFNSMINKINAINK